MNWIQLLSDRRAGEEKKKNSNQRSKFEQDYDRIIFSHPFRMLQDKTQVFPLPKQDFVHTRLTHSLEVASVGRSLGKLAGERVLQKDSQLSASGISSMDFGAIVSAASLMHDLGNPPFGHAGESAISQFFKNYPFPENIKREISAKEWADLTNFEGNAQGFRLVNKENYQGLKLTYATLGAFTKYPRESNIELPDKSRKSQKKYGFLQCNKEEFKNLATETGLIGVG
jgi:dGTPase